jgi:hypothetical protein
MFMPHKRKKKRGGFVPGFKGPARADRASRDEFDPAVRRAHGHLGEPQTHPMDGDEPSIWDADEDERARAHSGSDLLPYSSAAARAKSPKKPLRPVRHTEPAQDDEEGGHRGFAIHHVVHHMTFVTPHPGPDDDGDDDEDGE